MCTDTAAVRNANKKKTFNRGSKMTVKLNPQQTTFKFYLKMKMQEIVTTASSSCSNVKEFANK